jgi:hypothetical protein
LFGNKNSGGFGSDSGSLFGNRNSGGSSLFGSNSGGSSLFGSNKASNSDTPDLGILGGFYGSAEGSGKIRSNGKETDLGNYKHSFVFGGR